MGLDKIMCLVVAVGACAPGDSAVAEVNQAALLPPRTPVTRLFDYREFSTGVPPLLLGSAALVPRNPQREPKILRVTPPATFQTGAAWYPVRVPVAGGFATRFRVQFREPGTDGGLAPGADGLAFVVHNADAQAIGGVGCGLGYHGISPSLAVELDTFDNSSICNLGDLDGNHVSVHVGGNASESAALVSTGANLAVNLKDGAAHDVAVSYLDGVLRVFLDDTSTPLLEASVDLAQVVGASDGAAWIGFTAATGTSFQDHDVLRWSYDAVSVARCGVAVSGQAEDPPVTTRVEMGAAAGTAILDLRTLDRAHVVVRYEGSVVYDSGCSPLARRTVPVHWDGTSTQLEVDASPRCGNNVGSWGFELECPLEASSTVHHGADTNSPPDNLDDLPLGTLPATGIEFYAGRVGQAGDLINGACSIKDATGHDVLDPTTNVTRPCQFNYETAQRAGADRTYPYWFMRGPRDFRAIRLAIDQDGTFIGGATAVTDDMRNTSRRYGRQQAEALVAQAQRYATFVGGRVLFADIESINVEGSAPDSGFIRCSEGIPNSCAATVELSEILVTEFLERIVELGYIPGIYTNQTAFTRYFNSSFVPLYTRLQHRNRQIPLVLWITSCGETCGATVRDATQVIGDLPIALGQTLAGARSVMWQYYANGPADDPDCAHPKGLDLDAAYQDGRAQGIALGHVGWFVPEIPHDTAAATCQ